MDDECSGCRDHGPECSAELWNGGVQFHVWIDYFESGVQCDLCGEVLPPSPSPS
jgi:hypothetical protein